MEPIDELREGLTQQPKEIWESTLTVTNILHRLDALYKQHQVNGELLQQEGALFRRAHETIMSLMHRVEALEKQNQELREQPQKIEDRESHAKQIL